MTEEAKAEIEVELARFKKETTLACANLIEGAMQVFEVDRDRTGSCPMSERAYYEAKAYKNGYHAAQKELADMLRKVAEGEFK